MLVDTSVWVEFFNRPGGPEHLRVNQLLDEDCVAISGVIAAELVRGCMTPEEREEVEIALDGLHHFDVGFAQWVGIGREMFTLRQSGITVSPSDAAIAFSAREAGLLLYTLDEDFAHFPDLSRYP